MRFFLLLTLSMITIYAYDVSDKYFGMWGSNAGEASFEIESSFDSGGCSITVKINKIDRIYYGDKCLLIRDRQMGDLVCIDSRTRCVEKNHIQGLLLDHLNSEGVWSVSGVAINDTLNMRKGPASHYEKISALSYKAKHLKVLSVVYSRGGHWYEIRYNGIAGWVNGKFLKYKEK